jgi:phosphoglycolate phosphatase
VTASAIIVDLDGTLLDTRERHFHAYRKALLGLGGRPSDLAAFWAAKRRGAPWSRLLAHALGRPAESEVERRFLETFARAIEDPQALRLDRLQPGVGRALARLERAGIEPVLMTARRNEAALRRQLADLGLGGRFVQVVATRGAPKHGLVDAHVRARAAGWIGDTEDDCASARQLGIPILLVTNGIRTRSRLAQLHPDHLATSFGGAVRHHLTARR